jgi:ribokinase
MKILNFGSLNIDHVYEVKEFARPGETIVCQRYNRFCGGKGLNQSIALSHARATVFHAGKIGQDGLMLKNRLQQSGVSTQFVETVEDVTGHAIIQVNREGENSIVIFGGANRKITALDAERVLAHFSSGDYLLLQNEISVISQIIQFGAQKGLRIVFNPAPMTPEVEEYPLDLVDLFIVNEIEGQALTSKSDPQEMLIAMRTRFPRAPTALTLGKQGVLYADAAATLRVPAVDVAVVDTTAAGDTFIGYLVAGLASELPVENALRTACKAAAWCVTKPGAADSIPTCSQVESM